jgi:hypothetical protein
LAESLLTNIKLNLLLAVGARPLESAEDAALAFFAFLAVAAAVASRRLQGQARRFANGLFLSLALLLLAMSSLYVIRLRGGVWGGVRALMPWSPLLLVVATPLLLPPRRPAWAAALVLAAAVGFVALDRQEIRFFNRYKATDLEDQERQAAYLGSYIDRYHPRRVAGRVFAYGFTRYPVEVIWSLPEDGRELAELETAVDYEFIAVHWKSPLRAALIRNPRYVRINKPDREAELLIWRRLF